MHEPVKKRIEEVLAGGKFAEVETHLTICFECRHELTAMKLHSDLFHSLRVSGEVELSPHFYAKVMDRIENQAKPSIWSLFGESLFAKRLSYAAAMFLVLAGSLLVSYDRSEEQLLSSSPEIILSGQEQPEPVNMDQQQDRDVILVKLATYQDYQ